MKYKVIRNTDYPAVVHYMDILYAAANLACDGKAENTEFGARIGRSDAVIADSAMIASWYLLRGYRNIAVWMQGIHPEESYLNNRSKVRYVLLSAMECAVLRKAQCVFAVSDEMVRYYERKYRLDLRNKCFIMPCFNETGINERAFGNKDEHVERFVYIGSLSKWQCFEETVRVYAKVEELSSSPVSLTVLTKEQERAKEILERYGVRNFEVDHTEPEKLQSRLAGMKYGFVLRNDIAVNRVATPTKLANYLAAGIIPVYSSCLKSFHEINCRIDLAIPCDAECTEEAAQQILKSMEHSCDRRMLKEKCSAFFEAYYNTERYIEEIAEFLARTEWKG